MPRVSYFYGISIYIYFEDHAPPHIHARYAGRKAKFLLPNGEAIEDTLPRRATRLVKTWIQIHRGELLEGGAGFER